MNKKSLLVVASLLLLATACKEDNSVAPIRGVIDVSPPGPVLIIPLDDSVSISKGKGKPTKIEPTVPASAYQGAVMPEVEVENR